MHDEGENLDRFWQDVLAKAASVQPSEELTLEEAERRLATAGEAPLTSAKIQAILATVMATGSSESSAEPIPLRPWAPLPPAASRAAPSRRGRLLHMNPRMHRAAALLTGGLLLLTAAVVAKGVLWPSSRDPRRTLPYASAVQILADANDKPGRREAAAGRVFSFVKKTLSELQRLQQGPLRPDATWELKALGTLLALKTPLTRYEEGPALESALAKVASKTLSLAERRAWLETAATRASLGIQALNLALGESGLLPEYVKAYRKTLAKALAKK